MASKLFDLLSAALEGEGRVLEWAALPLDPECSAVDFPHLQKWISQGMHGEMSYMANHLHLREKPALMEDWAQSMVFFLWSYPERLNPAKSGPKISSYALGKDYHEEIKGFVFQLAQHLQDADCPHRIRPFTDSAPVFERNFAKELGLGWTGKNACLIHPKQGSAFFIGGFFIDAPLERSSVGKDFCGKCTKCIDACPTGAIKEAGVVDARQCISYLSIEKRGPLEPAEGALLKDWLFGCDVCQEVCPWNHKHLLPQGQQSKSYDYDFWINALKHGAGFNSKFKGTPLMRGGRKQLLRNLCHYSKNASLNLEPLREILMLEDEKDQLEYLSILAKH